MKRIKSEVLILAAKRNNAYITRITPRSGLFKRINCPVQECCPFCLRTFPLPNLLSRPLEDKIMRCISITFRSNKPSSFFPHSRRRSERLAFSGYRSRSRDPGADLGLGAVAPYLVGHLTLSRCDFTSTPHPPQRRIDRHRA